MMGSIVDHIAEAEQWIHLAGGYGAVMTLLFLAKQGYAITEQRLSFRVIYRLRRAIAEKILHMKSEILFACSTDDVMQMWNEDTRKLQSVSVKDIFNYLILTLSALLALVRLWEISFYFPFLALAVNGMSLLPVGIIGRRNKRHSQKFRESQVAMNEKFYTILNAIRLVKSYGKEKQEAASFERCNSDYVDAKMEFFLSSRIYKSVVTSLDAIAPTILLLAANVQVRDGRMSIGDIVLATSLLATVSQPFTEGGNFFISLKAIGFQFDHMFQFLDREEEPAAGRYPAEDPESVPKQNTPYALAFPHVFYQAAGVSILEDISLVIHSREKVAVVGESGSGKTTLSNLILRLYAPDEGALFLNGSDLQKLDLRKYREGIHYAQSSPCLSGDTILQNMTLLGASEDACIQAAKTIRFHEEISAMPKGYHTVVDAGASNLSGGQKKKIAVIRALTQRSLLYIFDEITRGIDETGAELIMNCLLDHIESTALFIMHNFHAIERMDRIIVMRKGRVLAQGSHRELYESCPYYRELYNCGSNS